MFDGLFLFVKILLVIVIVAMLIALAIWGGDAIIAWLHGLYASQVLHGV
jgi:hypothetical protein